MAWIVFLLALFGLVFGSEDSDIFSLFSTDFTPFVQLELPYRFDALEPVISEEIMQLHYGKHHKTYVDKLNAAGLEYKKLFDEIAEKESVGRVVADLKEKLESLKDKILFQYGGHVNHEFFWDSLAPVTAGGGEGPVDDLLLRIVKDFGSYTDFVNKFSSVAVSIQGSGWAVLGFNQKLDRLEISVCKDQQPLSMLNVFPLLMVDVWEHAYYLQYKNMRISYLKQIWNVVNWKKVQHRLVDALNSEFN